MIYRRTLNCDLSEDCSGAVLHEDNLEAGSGGGDGGAGAGETATDHDEIGGEIFLVERSVRDGRGDDHRRGENGARVLKLEA